MFKRSLLLFVTITTMIVLSGCSGYNQVLKSNDVEYKLKKAKEYYNKGDYFKAQPLFEELISIYRGKPELEEIYYFYSYSFYGQEKYLMSAYNFKNFTTTFPNSKYAEEAEYMHATSFYMLSPRPTLDQTYTLKAIDAFQLYITKYPSNERVAEANELIADMRRKLEVKALNAAQLYYDMGNYQAASVAFTNFLKDYPDSPEAELASFLIIRSYYQLARRSVELRQTERFQSAIDAYTDFVERYPNSKFLREAEGIYSDAIKELNP